MTLPRSAARAALAGLAITCFVSQAPAQQTGEDPPAAVREERPSAWKWLQSKTRRTSPPKRTTARPAPQPRDAAPVAPQHEGNLAALARQLEQEGELVEAEKVYRAAVKQEPQDASSHHRLGVLLAKRGELAAAEEQLRAALDQNPTRVEALNDLGYCCFLLGRKDEAEQTFRRALEIDPDHITSRNNLARVLSERDATAAPAETPANSQITNSHVSVAPPSTSELAALEKLHASPPGIVVVAGPAETQEQPPAPPLRRAPSAADGPSQIVWGDAVAQDFPTRLIPNSSIQSTLSSLPATTAPGAPRHVETPHVAPAAQPASHGVVKMVDFVTGKPEGSLETPCGEPAELAHPLRGKPHLDENALEVQIPAHTTEPSPTIAAAPQTLPPPHVEFQEWKAPVSTAKPTAEGKSPPKPAPSAKRRSLLDRLGSSDRAEVRSGVHGSSASLPQPRVSRVQESPVESPSQAAAAGSSTAEPHHRFTLRDLNPFGKKNSSVSKQ